MSKVDKASNRPPAKTEQEESRAKAIAELAICPAAHGAVVVEEFTNSLKPEIDVAEVMVSLIESARRTRDGDLSTLEAMLVSQSIALQTIFSSYACRAQAQTQHRFREGFMAMALKAQAQSRATIQAVIELKYPRQQATFVKQANIAHGPQQVNNGTSSDAQRPPTHAEETQPMQDKLLEEVRDGSTNLDPGATPAASRGDKAMAAMAKVHRPKKRKG